MEDNQKVVNDRTNNVLGALSYLSIFFAPVLFPIIVWIVAEPPASTYSKKALLNHVMSWVCMVLAIICFAMAPAVYNQSTVLMVILFILDIAFILGSGALFIINIVRGIQLLID